MILSSLNCAKLINRWRQSWLEFLCDAFERSAMRHVEEAKRQTGLAIRDQKQADATGQRLARLDME